MVRALWTPKCLQVCSLLVSSVPCSLPASRGAHHKPRTTSRTASSSWIDGFFRSEAVAVASPFPQSKARTFGGGGLRVLQLVVAMIALAPLLGARTEKNGIHLHKRKGNNDQHQMEQGEASPPPKGAESNLTSTATTTDRGQGEPPVPPKETLARGPTCGSESASFCGPCGQETHQ